MSKHSCKADSSHLALYHRSQQHVEFVLMAARPRQLREQAIDIKLRLTLFDKDAVEIGVTSGTTDIALGRIVDPDG